MHPIILTGHDLTLEKAQLIAQGTPIQLSSERELFVSSTSSYIQKLANLDKPIYGVNTGFGYFANQKIPKDALKKLQVNLLKSHAASYGTPLSISETRLAMALRLNVFLKGFTGVTWTLCQAFADLINAEIYPIIPEYGSVGASGDLSPLAHLALPLIGLGTVRYQGKEMPAKKALLFAGLKPYHLKEKEGISLINGTQIMLSVGSLALFQAERLLDQADLAAALSLEALNGSTDAFHPLIHEARGQTGQITSALNILKHIQNSSLFDPGTKKHRLQDPYSLRCAPQIHGPSRDALRYTKDVVEKELNAATDNPLIFLTQKVFLSGGNFHGQCLAMAFDIGAIALAEIGNVSERRLELLLNPHLNGGLPAFLTPKEGIHSGYMAMQYLSASLVNENKGLANPACTDSIPGNVGIEDHVSMGMTSARKFRKVTSHVRAILATEILAAAQAIDLRKVKKLGKGTMTLYKKVRQVIPMLNEDRILSHEIQQMVQLLEVL